MTRRIQVQQEFLRQDSQDGNTQPEPADIGTFYDSFRGEGSRELLRETPRSTIRPPLIDADAWAKQKANIKVLTLLPARANNETEVRSWNYAKNPPMRGLVAFELHALFVARSFIIVVRLQSQFDLRESRHYRI